MLLELVLGLIGFFAILGGVILSVVFMAYKAQSPGKGYVSELEQYAWLALGFLSGAGFTYLFFGSASLVVAMTFVVIFCSSIVMFGLT